MSSGAILTDIAIDAALTFPSLSKQHHNCKRSQLCLQTCLNRIKLCLNHAKIRICVNGGRRPTKNRTMKSLHWMWCKYKHFPEATFAYKFTERHYPWPNVTTNVLQIFCRSKLEETKLKQKLREKPNGVNVIGLAIGEKVKLEDVVSKDDVFKVKSGGMVNMQNLKAAKKVDDAYDVGIGTQFSAETNKRDEDEEMMK